MRGVALCCCLCLAIIPAGCDEEQSAADGAVGDLGTGDGPPGDAASITVVSALLSNQAAASYNSMSIRIRNSPIPMRPLRVPVLKVNMKAINPR